MQSFPRLLSLQTPSTSKDSPSIFEFERFRDAEFDWFKHIRPNGDFPTNTSSIPTSIAEIKEYFYSNWKKNYKDQTIFGENVAFSGLTKTTSPHTYRDNEFWAYDSVYYMEGVIPDPLPGTAQITEVFCMVHKPSQRLYCFLDKNSLPLTKSTLNIAAGATNAEAWRTIDGIPDLRLAVVYQKPDEFKVRRSTVDYIQREAMLFKEEYQRLQAQWDFVDLFNTKGKIYVEKLFDDPVRFQKLWDDTEEFEKVSDAYANMKNKKAGLEQKMRQLAEKVKELGYFLALRDEKIGEPTVEVKAGKIYQTRLDSYLRQELYTRMEWRRVRSGKNTVWRYVPVTSYRTVVARFLNYIEVNFDKDPVVAATNELATKGFNVYFVRKENSGFFTESGVPLETILNQCEDDENFRAKCCVVIPKYDFIISNRSYYVGAFVYKCPLPGLLPTRFPTIGIREELSYRLAWIGTEIGQLVSSINLAPGETRTMNVSSKFRQTTSQTASFKSVTDVNTSESFDLATEFQNEASNELTRTNSFSASAGGGFGIGPFSASASASGSRSTTLKTFSKEMARVAKKTAQTLNRKLSQEITSSSSVTTEVDQESSKSITITNINKGTTLNLFFYQVNNRYDSALYVSNLEMLIGGTKELIAGSGLYNTYSYRLHEQDQAFEKLHPNLLPGNPFGETDPQWPKYWKALEDKLNSTINDEYKKTGTSSLESAGVLSFQATPKFERLANHYLKNGISSKKSSGKKNHSKEDEKEMKRRQTLLTAAVERHDILTYLASAREFLTECQVKDLMEVAYQNIQINEGPLEPQKVVIASGGLYIDSHMGIMQGTEDYAELMRGYEAEKAKVEIDKQDALNDQVRAKTAMLLAGTPYIKNIFSYYNTGGAQTINYSQLQISKDITTDKNWKVFIEGTLIDGCTVAFPDAATKNALTITWPGELPDKAVLDNELALVNTNGMTLYKI
jgi:hypothetical protein